MFPVCPRTSFGRLSVRVNMTMDISVAVLTTTRPKQCLPGEAQIGGRLAILERPVESHEQALEKGGTARWSKKFSG